jgi:cyclase
VFRTLKVMHAGDVFPAKATPFIDRNNGGNGVTYPEAIGKAASTIKDVDTVIPGHSPVTTWTAFVEYGEFNKAFLTAVQDAKKAGKTAEQAAAELKLPEKFKDYNVGRAKVNVEAIYADLP